MRKEHETKATAQTQELEQNIYRIVNYVKTQLHVHPRRKMNNSCLQAGYFK